MARVQLQPNQSQIWDIPTHTNSFNHNLMIIVQMISVTCGEPATLLPCFQKQLQPAKPLLCQKYSHLDIQIGFV